MVSIIALAMSMRVADCGHRRPSVLERLAIIEDRGYANGSAYLRPLYASQATRRPPGDSVRASDMQTPMPCGLEPLLVRSLIGPAFCWVHLVNGLAAKSTSAESCGSAPSACSGMPSLLTTRTYPTRIFHPSYSPSSPPSNTRSRVVPLFHPSSYSSWTPV